MKYKKASGKYFLISFLIFTISFQRSFHSIHQDIQFEPHFGGRKIFSFAMTWQNPLKLKIQKTGHRFGLLAPGIPGDALRSAQLFPLSPPPYMIARKQISV